MNQSVNPAIYQLYTQRVAVRYHQRPAAITGRRRAPYLIEPRWVLWLALADDGYTITAIADAAGRHHSSVLHGLHKIRTNELAQATADEMRALIVPDCFNPRELGVSALQAGELRQYCFWLLGRVPFNHQALGAIRLIAARPELRTPLHAACEGYEVQQHLWRAPIHARQIGAAWIGIEGQLALA